MPCPKIFQPTQILLRKICQHKPLGICLVSANTEQIRQHKPPRVRQAQRLSSSCANTNCAHTIKLRHESVLN